MPSPAPPPTPTNPADAPGAVPPTGGVPPEDARASSSTDSRSATDDLADGIDLLLRAARKAVKSLDPGLEAAAARAVTRLQELDEQVLDSARERLGAEQQKLEALAADMGKDIASVLKRVAERIDANWREPH